MARVIPTVIIGIGGTGKAVLQDIRARLIARYGALDRIPVIRFLALDTDLADPDEELRSEVFFSASRRLADAEVVHLTVSSQRMAELKSLMKSGNLSGYYPYLADWLEPEALAPPQVSTGAGQIRQIGRLAFFENYKKIQAYINSTIKDATSEEALRAARSHPEESIEVDMRFLNLFVVGSTIGGTGAGLLVDLGYLLQSPEIRTSMHPRQCEPTGIFVVPLAGTTRSSVDTRASAYATLRELNHWSDPQTSYEVLLPDGGKLGPTSEPPYSFMMLVSNQGEGAVTLSPRKLVQLIGQRIYLESTSNFFAQVSSNRDNIRKEMASTDLRGCNQNFLTFGLATLEIPAPAVATAAACLLMANAFRELELGPYQDRPNDFKLDPGALARALGREGLSFDDLRKAVSIVEPGKTMEQAVSERLTNLQSHPLHGLREAMLSTEKELDALLLVPDGAGVTPGAWVSLARRNQDAAQARLRQMLDDMVGKMLLNPEERLIFALRVLREARSLCDQSVAQATQALEAAQRDLEGARKSRDRHRTEVIRLIQDSWLFLSVWRHTAIRDYLDRYYLTALRRYLDRRVTLVVMRHLVALYEALQHELEECYNRVVALERWVSERREEFERKAHLAESNCQPVNGVMIGDSVEGDSIHGLTRQALDTALGGGPGRRDRLLSFMSGALAGYLRSENGQPTPYRFEGLSAVDRDALMDDLLVQASQFIKKHGGVAQMTTLDAFYARSLNHSGYLSQLKSLSSPYLLLDRSSSYFKDHPVKTQRLVGFQNASTGDNKVATFKAQAAESDASFAGADGSNRFVEIEDPARIIWYSEYGAFPLRLWQHMEPMRVHYETHLQRENVPIHTRRKDYRWLELVKTAPEDRAAARRLFIVANIPGIEVFSRNKAEYVLRWRDDADLEMVESFRGTLDEIVDTLCQRKEVLEVVQERLHHKRGLMGDLAFADLIRGYRNRVATEMEPERAKDFLRPLDEYLNSLGLRNVLRESARGTSPTPSVLPLTDGPPAGSPGHLGGRVPGTSELEATELMGSLPGLAPNGGHVVLGSEVDMAVSVSPEAVSCGSCGRDLRTDAKFCDHCGAPRSGRA